MTLTSSTPLRKKPFVPNQSISESSGSIACGIDCGADAQTGIEHRSARPERRIPARRDRAVEPISPADCETVGPECQTAQGIDHQIHAHRMGGVFRAAQARFDHRKSGLHEHHQETGDQHPNHVDRKQVMGDAVVKIAGTERLLGISPLPSPAGVAHVPAAPPVGSGQVGLVESALVPEK